MKTSIYNRIASIQTDDLIGILAIWNRLIDGRVQVPRHDYLGKCALRATLILEERGVFATPLPHHKPIRSTSQRRS